MIKAVFRLLIRRMIGVREYETIPDAILRKKYRFLKMINRSHFTANDLRASLKALGLEGGDSVIVHSAWRAFIGYDGDASSVIDVILDVIGPKGTLIMPAYTNNKSIFRYNDPSAAGYITEIFRKNYAECRSLNAIFSMCACGPNATELTVKHIDSKYAFDESSPYSLAINKGAKILLMGLGKKPHKITLFHCVTYYLRNMVDCYNDVYTVEKKVVLYNKNGRRINRNIIERRTQKQNNKRKFKKLFRRLSKNIKYHKINKLDLHLFNSREVFDSAKDYIIKNNYNLYKG